MIWIKNRSKNSQFAVYFGDNTDYLALTDADARADYAGYWNDTSPTSTVFSVGSDGDVHGASGENVIAYCFHSVDGYSKIGSYTGNGSTDGTFVYTGFRPAWIMFKRADASNDWHIKDTSRAPYNVMQAFFQANNTSAENTGSDAWQADNYSNGFKLRNGNTEGNANAGYYIYIAFAETPFKYSNAR